MDFNSFFVSGKPNLMKMKQPLPARAYGTSSAPDLCKKIENYQNLKPLTPAGPSALNGGLHFTSNLNTVVCAKCFASVDLSKLNCIKTVSGSVLNKTGSSKDNSCQVATGCKKNSNNCVPIFRSKSMPPDLQKFVYNYCQQDGHLWGLDLLTRCYPELFRDLLASNDLELDTDIMNITPNCADEHVMFDDLKKENKLLILTGKEKREIFMKHKETNRIYHSLDEINKNPNNTQLFITMSQPEVLCEKYIPLCLEIKPNVGENSFLKYPCCCECKDNKDKTIISQRIHLNMVLNNRSDSNSIESIDKNHQNNMTLYTVDSKLFANDTILIKEASPSTGDDVHAKVDAKRETEKNIASPSLPDTNGSQLANCQIDKIESNITEINAECEGVTVACLEKNSRPVSNYCIDNDQKLSSDIDNRSDYPADSNGKTESLPSIDTVDHAGVIGVDSDSGKCELEMPRPLQRRIGCHRYPPSALKVHSEVVDKTMQVSEGIDAILKRLGRHDDKSINDTMKSHDNSLHRLSAGDGSGQGQQKVSRFLLKRAQEKEAEAARKAEKEAQEQRDSVLSCEDKMKRLKQLFSKKSDFISASAIDDSANIAQVLTVAPVESDTHSRARVHSPIQEKQSLNDKQNSLLKSDHNFYHTETVDNSTDCLRETEPNDIIKCIDKDSVNICKSLTIATETQIIDEKEIKCRIIPPDPIMVPQSETPLDQVNSTDQSINVDTEGKSTVCSSNSSTTSVKLDCDSNDICLENNKCDKSTEIRLCVDKTVDDDTKSVSTKSAPGVIDSSLTGMKSISDTNETIITESVKPVIDTVEDKMAKLKAILAEKKKKSKCIIKAPATVNVVSENFQNCPAPDVVKVISKEVPNSEKKNPSKKTIAAESKQRKTGVKILDVKSAKVAVSCKAKDDRPKVKNEPKEEIRKEPLTINDVEGSVQVEVTESNGKQAICTKPPRKHSKGRSAKKDNKKYKNEHSSKKLRHKERDNHKRNIRDDLNFDANVETTSGPLYFSIETLQLHTDPKKKHHTKKTKSTIRDRVDKCVNYISSLPAKVAICKPSVLEIQDENLLPNQSSDEFVIVDKDELGEELNSDKKKSSRVRLPSECESEDSFVICFQGSHEDLRNASDDSDNDFGDSACSESDSSDDNDDSITGSFSSDDGYEGLVKKMDDDIDSGVIVGIMKKKGSRDSPGKSTSKDKKVSFTAAPPKVHKMIAWSYAYRQARIGTWERCARDAERFRQRIRDTSVSLDWVLKREHRAVVYFQRFRPLLMRAIREEKEAKAKKAKEDKEKGIKDKEIEEERLKQKEIDDKEMAEKLERDGVMAVDDEKTLDEKEVDNFKDASSVIVSEVDNLVVVETVEENSPSDSDKLLIVQKNEKCDLNNKINNVSNTKKGSLTVRSGKNGTRNIKSVSPLK